MASGKAHTAANQQIAAGLTALGLAGGVFVHPALLGLALGGWLGAYLTPDIDHHVVTVEEQRILQYSRVAGVLWHLY